MKALIYSFLLVTLASASAVPHAQFLQWDKNKDGKLSKDELPPPAQKNFDRVDKDRDGYISAEEDLAYRNRGQSASPSGVKVLKDLDYAGNDNPRQKLDLYLPENADASVPLVVFIHGGGWRAGSKDGTGRKLLPYVNSGKYAGASIAYRLTDEAQWPSQIHDCKAAIRWLRANAEEYGIDASRIAVWGTSAGGHLVSMLGTSHGVEGLEGEIGPHTDVSSEVQAVVDFFGPARLLTMDDFPGKLSHNAPDSPEAKLIGGPIQENKEKTENASPQTHVTEDDEPFLIIHGTNDEVVVYDQSVQFEKALEAAGVPATFITVEGAGHGRGFGPEVDAAVKKFLAIHLLGETHELSDSTVPAAEPRK